ncbi:hypothetical protein AH715_004462 [Salmonella enterica subsp. enterica]|nr:hypothetical protein [Salmonella enterica subsp. enterica]EEC0438803.1 hypothetical protein [Salmonella enterica subsp. enterica]
MNNYSQNQNNSALVCGGNILLNARNCFLMFRNAINILRHSRRFFRCACKALLPAAP